MGYQLLISFCCCAIAVTAKRCFGLDNWTAMILFVAMTLIQLLIVIVQAHLFYHNLQAYQLERRREAKIRRAISPRKITPTQFVVYIPLQTQLNACGIHSSRARPLYLSAAS